MKKFTLLLLLMFCITLTNQSYSQARKYVLFEHFTNASCSPCAKQNPVFDTTILKKNIGNIVHISYHASWPGTDPMNAYNASEVLARVNYYSVSGVPSMIMLGNKYTSGPSAFTQEIVDNAALETSPIRINLLFTPSSEGESKAKIKITTLGEKPSGNLRLHLMLIEKEVVYTKAPGTNGEKVFANVFRDAISDEDGDVFTPAEKGSSYETEYSFTIDNTLSIDNLYCVCFVQNNDTKEVLNVNSTELADWEYYSENTTFKKVESENNTFISKLLNTGNIAGNYRFILNKEQPNSWECKFLLNGNYYTDTADVKLEANQDIEISLMITSDATSTISNYLMSLYSLDFPTYNSQVLQFNLINNITDLIINNDSYWGDTESKLSTKNFESNYLDGLAYSENQNYSVTPLSIYKKGIKDAVLNNIKYLYFNVGWSFPSLTNENVEIFAWLLDNGGNLFISGQDIAWETNHADSDYGTTATKAFFKNYLSAGLVSDGNSENAAIIPVASDGIFKNVNQSTLINPYGSGDNGAYFYPDELSVLETGTAIFTYNNTSKIAAVRSNNDKYKVVYLGFSVEMISDLNVRKEIIKLSHDWFHGLINSVEFDNKMKDLCAGIAYPNPSNDYVLLPVNSDSEVIVEIIDNTGKIIHQNIYQTNNNQVRINTTNINSGVYLCKILSNGILIDTQNINVLH